MQERGTLLCSGHNGSYLGFVEVNDRNEWSGLDIDLCRALTVAIPGDPDKNQIVQLSWAQRFPALQSGDVVIKATGRTTGRDTELGLQFSIPYVFGGAQLMVRKELGTTSASDLGGGTVCVAAGTTIERIVADHLKAKNVERTMVSFEKTAEVIGAYKAGRCDAYAAWGRSIAVPLANQFEDADAHVMLSDKLSAETTAAAMRQGDEDWVDIVNWMLAALIKAEELGVTSSNVDEMVANPPNPTVARLPGVDAGMGERLGLRDTWAREMIAEMDNLWSNGGVLCTPVLD